VEDIGGGHNMSTGVHDGGCWLTVDVEDGRGGVAVTEEDCEIGNGCMGCMGCVLDSKGTEGVAVPLVIGPQSSSHAALLFDEEMDTLALGIGSEWSPLVTEGDALTAGGPASVTVTPRFSSIFLREKISLGQETFKFMHMNGKIMFTHTIPHDISYKKHVLCELLNI